MKLMHCMVFYMLFAALSLQAFDKDLHGKTCVVTGATSGIGRATSFTLASHGCQVILAARDEKAALAMIEEGQAKNIENMRFARLDLSSMKGVLQFVDWMEANRVAVDIFINNAGVFQKELVTTENGLESTFQVNFLSPFLLTKTLLEKDIIKNDAKIINIVSERLEIFPLQKEILASKQGGIDWSHTIPGDAAYARSKLMMLMYSCKLAREVKNWGLDIQVIALHPGGVKTKIYDNLPLGLGNVAALFMKNPTEVAQKIYTLLRDNEGSKQSILVGTKLKKKIGKFAYSEINQDHLIEISDDILKFFSDNGMF
jgi:retinol dehydrogenase 12